MPHNDPGFALNETLTTIKERRSIRTFSREEVSDEQIRLLLKEADR